MNRGIRRVGIALAVLILVLVGQLTYLQIVDADNLANDPRNVRAALRDANKPRGEIVSADGEVLARSVRSRDGTEFRYQREYPTGQLFSQVVGYQSFVYGNTGVERSYNDALVGRGLGIPDLGDFFSGTTGTVVLSMSAAAQREAQTALAGQKGSVVMLDLQTGAVLAMYSTPSFDPQPLAGHDSQAVQQYYEALQADPAKPDLPRAYRERFAPGSTFKVVTATVAIEDGVATPDRTFPVRTQLDLPLTDNVLRNAGGSSCGGTLTEGLVVSCNTTFGQLGLELGDRFVTGMRRFGIGDAPPIDLIPGAVPSVGPRPGSFDQNQPLFAFASFGQGDVATTPLQMALVAAAIGNGGVIMEPHVAAAIRTRDGDLVRRVQPGEWRRATTPQVAAAMTAMMVQVVERGTGTRARIPGVTVAGKTGTAEVVSGAHAWFIAFAPAEEPRYAVSVLVEGGGVLGSEASGGRVSAPIAARMLAFALENNL